MTTDKNGISGSEAIADFDDSRSTALLGELVSYLTRNYPDEQWDGTTRELLEVAHEHLGRGKIVWDSEEEEP